MNEVFDFRRVFKKSNSEVDLNNYTSREKIEILEWIILNEFDNIADELPLTHFIHGGIYAREMFIPSGVVLTGKIHLVDHLFSLDQGELSVMTDDGIKRISAPYKFDVRAGIKKVGYAHTDVICTTYHATDLIDIKELEKHLFDDGNIDWVNDLFDYKSFITEFNLDENTVYELSRDESDLEMPLYTAAITAAAIGVGASIGGAALQSSAAKKAAKKQTDANTLATQQQIQYAQQAYANHLISADQANQIINAAYANAQNQQYNGYQAQTNILNQTFGAPAQAATLASGTSPQQLQQWQQQAQTLQSAFTTANNKVTQISQQLNTMQYTPQTAGQIAQLQQQLNQAQAEADGLKKQQQAITQQIQTATPYKPAQAAQAAQVGKAPQALMTGAGDAQKYLLQGNNTANLALKTGYNTSTNALTNALQNSKNYVNQGYTTATGAINKGYNTATNAVNQGYTTATGAVNQGYTTATGQVQNAANQASKYQRPFYDAGVGGLKNMTAMTTEGNKFLPTDPGYQFRLQEGLKSTEQSAAARGSQLSGATLKALNNYGQGAASLEYQNAFNRNQSLAGIGQTAGTNMSNIQSNLGNQLSGLTTGKANSLSNLATNKGTQLSGLATVQGQDLSGLATNKGTQMSGLQTGYGKDISGLATNYGTQLSNNANNLASNQSNVASNLGTNLGNMYSTAGQLLATNANSINQQQAQNTLNQAQYLANNTMGNSTVYQNLFGNAVNQQSQNTTNSGNAQAIGQQNSANAWTNGLNNVVNMGLQAAQLYGSNNLTNGIYGNRLPAGYNNNRIGY